MTENFSQLFEESLKKISIKPGSIIEGTVISIEKDRVTVDVGLKSESSIPIEQFINSKGILEVEIGSKIDVTLDTIENGFGETISSREKAKKHKTWIALEKIYRENQNITGTVNEKVKGGFTIDLKGVRAFLPGSLVDIKQTKENMSIEGKELVFKIIKLDKKNNNIVVSRRAVIEYDYNIERNKILENLNEGMKIKGIVKNITDYGAFIDLTGIDGLLHITDIAWKRINHPSEILKIGDEIFVKVLKFDRDKTRVSLGLKQLYEDPWNIFAQELKKGSRLTGKVTNLTEYGCFVEIKEGIEGLVHVSEMDWTNKNIHPSKIVKIGEKVEVTILDIELERRRISLSIKKCKTNPWKKFAEIYKKNSKIKGKIKSITDFGIFIGLEGGIDGLVHLSDISWTEKGEEAVKKYKKGDTIETVVLQIDTEKERISLGIKQLLEDPLNTFSLMNKKGSSIEGKIIDIDEKKIIVELKKDIKGLLPISKNHKYKFSIGEFIKSKILNIDKKERIVNLITDNKKDSTENNNKKKISNNELEKFPLGAIAEAFKAAKKG